MSSMVNQQSKEILLANPRGFCAGVDRAIDIVNAALEKFGAPVYVRHEVVHNRYVVNELKAKGAIFVDELVEVPDSQVVIFSAHGVSQAVRNEAKARNLQVVIDATCPLVSKVHMEVMRYSRNAEEVILIGHKGHAEVEGTLGQYTNAQGAIYLVESVEDAKTIAVKNPDKLCYATQTTLSVDDTKAIIDALRERFPNIYGPKKDDICYATQNRQDAVKVLAKEADIVLVVGSKNSSNSNRLKELAKQIGTEAYLIDTAEQIDLTWFVGKAKIGITAGASAPEVLVNQVVNFLKENFSIESIKELVGRAENVAFSLPKEVRDVAFTE